MFENEEELKKPLRNTMQIAIVHPNSQQNDLYKKIIDKATPEFKDRLKFSFYKNYKEIYKDLGKLPFTQEAQSYKKGLINEIWINELYEKRPSLIIYFYFIQNGANKALEEKKIYENISEIKKYDELVYICLFIISKDIKENPYNFKTDEEKPYNLKKLIPKELIFEFPDDNIWKMIDIGTLYNILIHYIRLYYRIYKIKIKDKKIKSTSREEKIECNILLGILSAMKTKKTLYIKSKYLDEAYFFISEKNYNKNEYLYGDKSLGLKFNLNEIRATADWLFYKLMFLQNNNKIVNANTNKNQNNKKNNLSHSLSDIMGKQQKNKSAKIDEDDNNDIINKYIYHIKSFSFLDTIIKGDKNDNFILIEYFWLLQRYKDFGEFMEENVKLSNNSKKKVINLLMIYLKQIFYYIKMMRFYSKKKLENSNSISVKNKEININRIDAEFNYIYGRAPIYSYKDINNPLVKFELGFNEDVYIKKFLLEKKINFEGPMKEIFNQYINKIPNLLQSLQKNIKNKNFCGGIDLYINMLKISLLFNKIEKENKNVFGDINLLNINDEIFKILNDSDYFNINNLKKFPKVYLHYSEMYIKSLIYNLNSPEITNISKTKLFINLSIIGNIRKLKEEEENVYFQLINDENFIPEIDKSNQVIIKLDSDKKNQNPLFYFDYKLKNENDTHEKKILDLVEYNFQLKTNLSKENIKLNYLKVYILCINEDEFNNKNNKKEIIIKEYTKDELSNFDLNSESPINLDHKIFMKYKKGKIYLTQVEFSLSKKENIIYKLDLPINLSKMIFITNLNKKVLNIKIPKEKLTVGLNQFNKFEIEVNKEELDEVHISQFKMNFMFIPSYYKKSVPNTSMKALLNTKTTQTNKGIYSSKVTEQIFGLPKKQENLIGLVPPEKTNLNQNNKPQTNNSQSSMQNFLYKNPNDNKQNATNNNNTNKTPMFPIQKASTTTTNIPNEIIQVPMPPPIFYYLNEENKSLDNIEKNYEKEYNDFESIIKSGKNKFGVLMKFSLTGQYEIKLNISYSIRHRDIEDYIWFSQEEILKFIVIEPFKLSAERDSSDFVRRTKILQDKKEEKSTEFFSDQKVQMNIILTNQLNEDIIIKDIIIKLNEEQLGEKNKEIKLKCPTKDIIDSDTLPLEIKNQILKIIKMADYNIPFETKFNSEFRGSLGKFILKWTTPSLLNYENLEINNENIIDFPEVAINSQRLKLDYNTYTNENDEIMLNINITNKTNESIKIQFIIENGKELDFIVSGVTKQVHNIKANEIINVIFRLIPLIRKQELKLPTIKIYEMNFDSADKICSNYYFLDKIYVI